jgi:LPXTG-motif cell wall-anchored protein
MYAKALTTEERILIASRSGKALRLPTAPDDNTNNILIIAGLVMGSMVILILLLKGKKSKVQIVRQ